MYALLLEDLRQEVSTAALAAMIARVNGADAPIPNIGRAIDDFDAALAAPPEQVADPAKHDLMRALGLR